MKQHNQRVLVTGGAGFIGSALVRQLAEQEMHVTVVDNLVNGRRENLADLPPSLVQLAVADIRDETQVRQLLGGIDVVYHLACLGVRHSIHSPDENHDVNATATLRLLQAARSAGVGRFVYVSSSEVYGTARTVPMTEDHTTLPTTVYGASKLAGECYTRAFFQTYGYPTVVVRPFNAYGPRCHHEGDSGEVIPKFLLRSLAGQPMIVFGDGTQRRDFTFVEDTAAGILAAGTAETAIGETINLGSGHEISINHLAAAVAEVVGCSPNVQFEADRPGDVYRLYADANKAKQLLGFKPQVSLPAGLAKLKAWYQSQPAPPHELLQQETVRNWETEAA